MLRKLICLFAAGLLLASGIAQASTENWMADENGLKLFFKHRSEWTFVTPGNVEEHMALCTSRGYTEQEVRERFASGRVRWEAYHKRIPDGLLRYEVWSDAYTRNAWDLNRLSSAERKDWTEAAFAAWDAGKYAFVDPAYQSMGKEKHILTLGVIQNPPATYESGYGALYIRNGQALLLSYFQTADRASKTRYIKQTYDFLYSEVGWTDWNETIFVPDLLPEAVDLTVDGALIVNAHTGDVTLRGTSEKGAEITAAWGGDTRQTDAKSSGAFAVTVPVTAEGAQEITLTAAGKGRSDNYADAIAVPMDNAMARLTLTAYPQTTVDDAPIAVSGVAAPGALVFLTMDDGDPVMLTADGDGAFAHTFGDVEDFVPHALTVTANEEGLADTTVTLPFARTYIKDVSKGIGAFKAKTIRLSSAKLAASPEDYIGAFIRMEFRTTGVARGADGLTLQAKSMDSDTRRPMILKASDYLDDAIVSGMNITVYGIVEGTDAETGLPVVRIVYVSYLKMVYR